MDTKIKHRDIPVKLCRSCEDELPASRFRPDPRMKSGLGLGKFRDRPDLLIAASAYLEKQR